MNTRGWVFLFAVSAAGVALFIYETRKNVRSSATAVTLMTTGIAVQQGGTQTAVPNAPPSNAAGQQTIADVDDPGSDDGVGPQSRGQTEAAYHQGTDLGSGTGITLGATTDSDDFDSYADPSEVYGV